MTSAASLRPQLAEAMSRRDWARVRSIATQLLSHVPDQADVHFAAGLASLELRAMGAALQHLEIAARLAPDRVEAMVQLARALAAAKRPGEACVAADRAASLAPDAAAMAALGAIYSEAGAHDKALAMYVQAAERSPKHAAYRYNEATAWVTLGDAASAGRAIEACLRIDPSFARAHLMLAHLRRQTVEENHVPRLERLLAELAPHDTSRMALHMALAKEYDDLEQSESSFRHLSAGKALGSREVRYDSKRDEALFAGLARAFPRPPRDLSEGAASQEPIFVFGMPRSGTTLVERILASHPDVHDAGELLNFGMALRRHWGNRPPIWEDPEIAAHAASLDWRAVGETYVASTRPATGHTRRFVDKFPFNFLYAGFIASALPQAKLVCLRRHPMDSCLGNFRQLFAEKLPYYDYSFDLLDTGRYYVQFDRLMAHWRQVFPGRILELDYEALVTEPQTTIRSLLAFCDLPWHEGCLSPEVLPGAVATASALQVREPIHARSVGQWRRYEAQLGELRELLLAAGIDLDR